MATSGSKTVAIFSSWINMKFSWWQNSQSVENNTTSIGWKMELITGNGALYASNKKWTVTIDGTTKTGTVNISLAKNSTQTLASGTATINHNDDGTKTFSYSFSQQFNLTLNNGNYMGTYSGSGSDTLTTIARASQPSCVTWPEHTQNVGEFGDTISIHMNRKSSSFTHTVRYKFGSQSGTIATGVGTGTTWTIPLTLMNLIPNALKGSGTIYVDTYSGSTKIGTKSCGFTATVPSSVKPTCTVDVSDPTGYLATYGAYVKGLSKFAVTITPTLAYSSAIKTYNTNANGSKYTTASFTTGVLQSSGTLIVSTTVTDNRGRSGSADSESLAVLNYTAPSISKLTVRRCDADGTENNQGEYVQVTFSGSVTALNDKNSATYTLEYKKSTESDYISVTLTDLQDIYSVTDSTYIFSADTGSSYNVRLTVTDDFLDATRTTSASTAFTLIHWLASGLGMAIGKIAELTNVLDIGFQTRFSGGILHPVLEPETDLDDVLTPNTYIGGNLSHYNYANCPLDSGTFTLEVVGAGETDQVKQRVQSCGKVTSRAFERYYYSGTWGNWFCVSDYAGTLLWEDVWYMLASQTANLSEAVSKQKNGIVLVFVEYINGAVANSAFHSFFVPKQVVELHPGKGHTFVLATGKFNVMATKYLYISDTSITGNDDNSANGTGASGVEYTNNRFVLRYVLGV